MILPWEHAQRKGSEHRQDPRELQHEVEDNGGDVTKIPFPVYMYVDYVRVYQKAE